MWLCIWRYLTFSWRWLRLPWGSCGDDYKDISLGICRNATWKLNTYVSEWLAGSIIRLEQAKLRRTKQLTSEYRYHLPSCALSQARINLGNFSASEFYILHTPTCLWVWNRQSAPKRRNIKFRCRGNTRKKAYNIQNTAKVWNHEYRINLL
jgi:hypothetical protein